MDRRRLLVMSSAALLTACAPAVQSGPSGLPALYARPDANEWPEVFRKLPDDVQAMYRYAVKNEAVLKWMPCTCGCVAAGHASNFDCYVKAVLPDGRVQLDTMSFG